MKRWIMTLLVVGLLAGSAMACPNCKDSVPNSDSSNPSAVGPAFNYSIYLMLGAFLSVLGLVGAGIVRAVHTSGGANPPVQKPEGRGFEVRPMDKE